MRQLAFTLLYLYLLLSFSSCLTVRKIERNCDKFVKVCVSGSETKTVYRDSVIYLERLVPVPLPADTVKIHDTLSVENNLAFLPGIYREFGLIGVDAEVKASILYVNAYLTDSTLLFQKKDTVLLEKVIREQHTNQSITLPPVRYIPGFYKFTMWFFIVSLIGIIAFVLWKISGFKS